MRTISTLIRIILLLGLAINHVHAQTNEEVIGLVKETRAALEQDAEQTIDSILFAEHPYKNENNPSLYVFVLDTNLTVAAHPIMPHIVGVNLKGKPDVKGKMFREEMLKKALSDGSGWVDYHYMNPQSQKITQKMSYFELANGSYGVKYSVGCGKYMGE